MVMKREHLRKCLDVCMMQAAGCNTDHRLVRAKIVVGKQKEFQERLWWYRDEEVECCKPAG